MLATLVIGLREGLEAALIVGIIAAFLRKNGQRLTPMWVGVGLALLLSVAVGIGLHVVEQALPQAAQEGMETAIGAVAVVFVTGMIVWMNRHARGMKSELETGAAQALSRGGAASLAVMAFLAVLKEGFETSVFMLATFSAAQSARLAVVGAVAGVLLAAVIGWGIYAGGVRLNLGKFFRITGAFLILVAAGLVGSLFRTAHEAGWVNAGQQRTLDLSWLVRPGTVQSALITGVLGIPADPRLIEVVGWLAYLVPVTLFVYWPASRRPAGEAATRVRFALAGGLAAVGLALALFFPAVKTPAPAPVALVAAAGESADPVGTAWLRPADGAATALTVALTGSPESVIPLPTGDAKPDQRAGVEAAVWSGTSSQSAPPAETMTLKQLMTLNGGRLPIGINPQNHPGPFDVQRSVVAADTVWVSHGILLDAASSAKAIATISGGGLDRSRTISVADPQAVAWRVSPDDVKRSAAAVNGLLAAETERVLWAVQLPIGLGLAALLCAAAGLRSLGEHRPTRGSRPRRDARRPEASAARHSADLQARSDSYAAH